MLFMALMMSTSFVSCSGDDDGGSEGGGNSSFLIGRWTGTLQGVSLTYNFYEDNTGYFSISGGNYEDFTWRYTAKSEDHGVLTLFYDNGDDVVADVYKYSDGKVAISAEGDYAVFTKSGYSGGDDEWNDNDDEWNDDDSGTTSDPQANWRTDILGTWYLSSDYDQELTFYSDGTGNQIYYSSYADGYEEREIKWYFQDYDDVITALVIRPLGASYATVYGIEGLTSSKMVLTYNGKTYIYYKH